MKKYFEAAMSGIFISSVVFVLINVILGLLNGDAVYASGYGIARQGIATIMIGLGYGIPLPIYKTKIKTWLKVFVHMGIGCVVMIAASFIGRWLPIQNGALAVVAYIAAQVLCAFLIWSIGFIPATIQAKKINKKINESSISERNEQEQQDK